MRMFLVGMCDVFLLLYLTALAQVDARQLSNLTVKDYVSLKETATEKEKELQSKERLTEDTLRKLTEAQLELAHIRKESDELKQKSSSIKNPRHWMRKLWMCSTPKHRTSPSTQQS